MLIAQQKKEENIAEYVLYMWQLEDLLRAHQFNLEGIKAAYIDPLDVDDNTKIEIEAWYEGLVKKMRSQRVEKKGHIEEVKEVMLELFYLHNTLLSIIQDNKYKELLEKAAPYINEFQKRGSDTIANEIEVCLTALYAKLLLRLQQKEISEATETAMVSFTNILAYLAHQYKKMKKGELNFQMN